MMYITLLSVSHIHALKKQTKKNLYKMASNKAFLAKIMNSIPLVLNGCQICSASLPLKITLMP